ncbi:MAG: MucB/RseB C-terminal domain-containing protein [Steroidobacterales bacterium]
MTMLSAKSAGLLASYALMGLGVAAAAQPPAADEPRTWLEKMNSALATRNYDGTFFHLSDGRVETMRIVHRFRAGRVTERLMSLDGSGREFVRNNDELTCYLPDKNTILVEPRQANAPFLGSLPQFGTGVDQFYRLDPLPDARVMGRPVHGIAVSPRDQYRFGYRLWLDAQTAMPLKTQLCDSSGRVIEQIQFAHLEMPDNIPDSALTPDMPVAGMRVIRHGAHDESAARRAGFRAIELPPGFHLTMSGARVLGGAGDPVMHMVYSDGLATVSVFVESARADTPAVPSARPLARVGSGFAFSTVVQGHQVTAVGEVPAQTVELIAHSVRPEAAADSAPH